MRFVFSAGTIVLKRSAAIILCVFLCLFGMVGIFSVSAPLTKYEPLKIAIVNQDDSAVMLPLVTSMLESRLGGMLKAELCDTVEQASGHSAVLVLPEGFFESVMTGENLTPRLTVNASSPFEGLWINSLAKSAAKLISEAQNVVGAVNTAAQQAGLSTDERDKVIMSLNGYLLNDYLTRKGRFESVVLSATGSINAVEHYTAAAVSFFCFVMAFMLFAPVKELRQFAVFSKKKMPCLISVVISCFLLSLAITAAAVIVMGGSAQLFSSGYIKAALLIFSVMLFFPSATDDMAGCAALCCGSCLFQAVLGGAILPEALLPTALAALSNYMPLTILRRLLADIAYNCGFGGDALLLAWCAVLLSLSVFCWLRKGEAA